MKIYEQLKAAKEIIKEPAKWTTEATARDKNGEQVGYTNPDATCFCSFGALLKAATDAKGGNAWISFKDYDGAVEMLKRGFNTKDSVGAWNDSHTHAEVLEGFDNAIALAEIDGV